MEEPLFMSRGFVSRMDPRLWEIVYKGGYFGQMICKG